MDVNDEILEYFEENDWEMSSESVEQCADKLKKEFDSEEDAFDYVNAYLNSLFGD